MKSPKNYEELLLLLNNNQDTIIVSYIGSDSIIDKILDEEGPINTYEEKHGFDYGPFETINEYREIDEEDSEVYEYAQNHYSELYDLYEAFVDAIKENKNWIDRYFNNDSKALEEYLNHTNPIESNVSKHKDFDDYFVCDLMEKLFS